MNDNFLLAISMEVQIFALRVAVSGALMCAIVLLTDRLMRRRSEPLRYGILFTGVVGLLAIPALVGIGGSVPATAIWPETLLEDEIVKVPAEMLPQLLNAPPIDAPTESEPGASLGQMLGAALVVLWLLGSTLGMIRLFWAMRKQGLAILGRPWQSNFWTEELKDELARKLGLRKFPEVCLSPAAPMPMVIGLWRPTIVLPEQAPASWDQAKWQAILLHEAAHIARRDHWALLAQRVAVLAFWWCPLAHLLGRRLNALRENICDDHALEGPCDQIAYAELLVESAERFLEVKSMPVPLALLDSAQGGLESRITRLLEKEKRPMIKLTWFGKVTAAGFLVLGCLLTTAATAFSQAQPQPAKKVQIKIIVDGKEIDLGDAKLLEHLEAAQKKNSPGGHFNIRVAPDALDHLKLEGAVELAFSPDGKFLATGQPGKIVLFDTATGRVIAQPNQVPAPIDPRIEELVKAAEKIKPGSGAEVRKALQGAARKTETTRIYDYYRAIPATVPKQGYLVQPLGDKKIIILSIQDGKVQQLSEQDIKKLLEQGQIRYRIVDDMKKAKEAVKPAPPIEFTIPTMPPRAVERKTLTTPSTPPPATPTPPANLDALQRQLERINAELLELRKRLDAGKKQ